MVNLLLTIRLAQSILKRKFPSVDKPLQKSFEKYKPRGLFSEFYGVLYFLVAIPGNVCETAPRSLFWAPNRFSDLPEVRFQFPFGYH